MCVRAVILAYKIDTCDIEKRDFINDIVGNIDCAIQFNLRTFENLVKGTIEKLKRLETPKIVSYYINN